MATTVRGPDGRTWKVGRRWVSRSVRWKGRRPKRDDLDWLDIPDVGFLDDEIGCGAAIATGLAIVLLVVVAIFFVFPAVIFLVEVVLLLLIVGGGVLARLLFRRPWTVEAVETATSKPADQRERLAWKIVGWRRSGEAVETVARHLEAGVAPTP